MGSKKKKNNNITGGKEEERIWKELEEEVERNLEEEIKDQIYHLALRLNRLYQHRMERSKNKEKPLISDHCVNICISMKGGTNVEIKETTSSPKTTTRVPKMAAYKVGGGRPQKKVDWVKTLRSGYNHSSLVAPGSSGGIDLC